jgi:DNA helicase II / ATP-dependent DNA helicase PcrA
VPLTPEQRATLWNLDGTPWRGHRVVSARPGTGKTRTLTEYCIDVVGSWSTHYEPWQGMAIVSYTNVAKDELEQKIRIFGRANCLLTHPHFVGTIDSFLNQYLFLPFGAKLMDYPAGRPKLVGEPYNRWQPSYQLRKSCPPSASSLMFFDCYGFSVNGDLIVIDEQPRNVKRDLMRRAEPPTQTNSGKIARMKRYVWSQGYALQNDANYIAYSTLLSSDALTRTFIGHFPVLIVDEAQDMTEVQHALLDRLKSFGQEHIVLMGDEYQAIYEWNTARPTLFAAKMEDTDWNAKTISETFRCSPSICSVLMNISADGAVLAPADTGKNKNYTEPVQVRVYYPDNEQNDVRLAIDDMATSLSEKAPHDGNADEIKTIAVLTRSKEDTARLRGYLTEEASGPTRPLSLDYKLTKDYLRVIYHLLKKDLYGAVGAYETLLFNDGEYASKTDMRTVLAHDWCTESHDSFNYRVTLFKDLREIATALPTDGDAKISDCTVWCSFKLKGMSADKLRRVQQDCASFAGTKQQQDRGLSSLFSTKDERTYLDHPTFSKVKFVFSTVHGVKGETYDGVIFYTKANTSACKCTPSAKSWAKIMQHELVNCENKRIAYVAISRAAQMLFVFAPESGIPTWQSLK